MIVASTRLVRFLSAIALATDEDLIDVFADNLQGSARARVRWNDMAGRR